MADAVREYIYRSRATHEMSPADLEAILATARIRNAESGVTGLLLYGDGDFLQVLEGRPAAVASVVERIRADSRHLNFDVISDRFIDVRHFADWSMAFHLGGSQPTEGFSDFLISSGPLEAGSELSRALAEAFRRLHP